MRIRSFVILFLILTCVLSCSTNSKSSKKTDSTANNGRLETAVGGASNQAPVQASRGDRPGWVSSPYSLYSRDRYIAAVGSAADRGEAEKRAFAGIAAYFGQSVQSDLSVLAVFSEAVSNGIISVSENTSVREMIVTAASLDTLIGAVIGNVWEDERGNVYALAFIEKKKPSSFIPN